MRGIDKDVKAILSEAAATGNVRDACNKAGLHKELERLQVSTRTFLTEPAN